MKYNKLIMLFIGFALVSCEDYVNSAEESNVTYLPKIEVFGESEIVLDCDATEYVDEGAVATEGGNEIALETDITGYYFGNSAVDGSDLYEIAYSAYNQDGVPAAEFRSVLWPECNGDLVTSIAGMYKADVVRNGSITPQYQEMGPIFIIDLGGGKYQLSDAIGGYYDFGRGYGYHYAATGMTVTANNIPGNDFTHDDVIVVGDFGGELVMTSFSVDAATKTIQFSTDWEFGYVFDVTLTQVQ